MNHLSVKQHPYSLMTALLSWSGMVVMCSLYVTIPLIDLFADLFQVSATRAAAAGSIFSLGFAAGCLVYGALSDRYGRKQVILTGMIALTLISLILGLVHNFAGLLVLRALQGAAAATFSPVALAYAVEMFPAERRVSTIGFISTGFLVAGIAGQLISSLLSQTYGWNAVFLLLSTIYALTAILTWLLLPKGEIHHSHAGIWEPIKHIGKVFAKKRLLLCYLVAFVLLMSFVGMYTMLGAYVSWAPFELKPGQILLVRAFGVLGMILSPFAGKLAKRLGTRAVLRSGLLMAIVGMAALGLISNLPLLVVMTIVFVAGIAIAVPSLVSLVGSLSGNLRGIAVSMYTFILFAGTSIGPVLALQFIRAGSFAVSFALFALVLGIGLIAALLLDRETDESPQPANK
ncbi:MAG: MFS transporter [Paenibacillus macerans]|nr:MFS transporter [Paenibacillus macerans]MDU7474662.1 MFS transporter [Paenibacillus macerans]MEC0333652.1 MFS transporter [Paenibacillus macerans]GBK62974.1 MFS transporter [Paenibacillus macerans]GBK69286.1 MFS transporter [Paenibacillus macerans]